MLIAYLYRFTIKNRADFPRTIINKTGITPYFRNNERSKPCVKLTYFFTLSTEYSQPEELEPWGLRKSILHKRAVITCQDWVELTILYPFTYQRPFNDIDTHGRAIGLQIVIFPV